MIKVNETTVDQYEELLKIIKTCGTCLQVRYTMIIDNCDLVEICIPSCCEDLLVSFVKRHNHGLIRGGIGDWKDYDTFKENRIIN